MNYFQKVVLSGVGVLLFTLGTAQASAPPSGSDGSLEDITFDGKGCAISVASASMMTELVKGKPVAEVRERIRDAIRDLLAHGPAETQASLVGALEAARRRLERDAGMETVLRHTGRAILIASMTTMIGFGSLALVELIARIAADYRRRSGEETALKPAEIMDVNPAAVVRELQRHRVRVEFFPAPGTSHGRKAQP